MSAPGFWMNETSGVVRPAIVAYLDGDKMTGEQIAAMRAYLRQWIFSPAFFEVDHLRQKIDGLTTREAIQDWLDEAMEDGIDPL